MLAALQRRMAARQHALIVVAEGAGQHLFSGDPTARDASGNVKYNDIGPYLRDRHPGFFPAVGAFPVNIKYIDPSYLIRSVPANTWDQILANQMGRNAVHAAMAGRTDALIGYWNTELVHVPIDTATATQETPGSP